MGYRNEDYEESKSAFTGLINGVVISLFFWSAVALAVITAVNLVVTSAL